MIDFENRMYGYEKEEKLDKSLYTVVRLDGSHFSAFTAKYFTKPYDLSFHILMSRIASRIKDRFVFDQVYTISDEITCIWKPFEDLQDIPFSGRVQKITSMVAGYTSSMFTYLGEIRCNNVPFFDCRTYSVPDIHEATNVFYWRAKNGYRNAVNGWSTYMFGHKQVQNISVKELVGKIPPEYIQGNQEFFYGTFVGKTITNLAAMNHDERVSFIWK